MCQRSFTTIKAMYPNVTNEVMSGLLPWPTHPSGCFLHLPSMKLVWNTHNTGSRSNDDGQVCDITSMEKNDFFAIVNQYVLNSNKKILNNAE